MVVCDKWVGLKIFELLVCGACVAAKAITDDEASRVFLYRQKLSREWSLLNNITWSAAGSSMADAVYGGYVIITGGLLIGRVAGRMGGNGIAEKFFLGLGAILFIVLGGLELASLDAIPDDLIDNAAVLGCLSLLVAVLFIIDLSAPRSRLAARSSQTEPTGYARFEDVTDGVAPFKRFGSLREGPDAQLTPVDIAQKESETQQIEVKQKVLPKLQSPVFERVRNATKGRAVISQVSSPHLDGYHCGIPLQMYQEDYESRLPSSPRDRGFVHFAAMQWEQVARGARNLRPTPTEV